MISPKFVFCVLGVYACFLTWGITQERVSTTEYNGKRFKFFIFLNLIQAMSASILSGLYGLFTFSFKLNRSLTLKYVQLGLLSTLASPFGYAALKHIDYPTLIIGKSCKLVPVMLMNFVLYRKTFPFYKYVVVFLITLGVSCFTLLHPQEVSAGKENSLYGLGLLFINLLMDGAMNSTQDKVFGRYKVSGAHM